MTKTSIILQARTSSKRLPGKVLKYIGDFPMILFQIERLKKAKLVDEIIVATTDTKEDDDLVKILISNQIKIHRSFSNDVLGRYADCLKITKSKNIIRITGDCPLIDSSLILKLIDILDKNSEIDYASNTMNRTFPHGFDIEIFRPSLLFDKKKLIYAIFFS